ncbi:MAG: hypothetical protein QXR26_07125 [Candidatus Caldarchaeum sp.]
MKDRLRFIIHGVLASGTLLSIYFLVVSLAQSYLHAVEEFFSLSYLMLPLVLGFGVQVSLFSYSRHQAKTLRGGSACIAVSGGVSSTAMIACCAHHITDVLPLLGFTAAAVFLTVYQDIFIMVGLLSNIIGITFMLSLIQRHRLYASDGIMAKFMRVDMVKLMTLVLIVFAVAAVPLIWSIVTSPRTAGVESVTGVITLSSVVNDANGLVVEVMPLPLSFGQDINFRVKMDTHVGDLDFDLTEVAYLEDSNGQMYLPKGWSGSPPGGHHREGILSFPPLSGKPRSIKLVLEALYGVDRVFE